MAEDELDYFAPGDDEDSRGSLRNPVNVRVTNTYPARAYIPRDEQLNVEHDKLLGRDVKYLILLLREIFLDESNSGVALAKRKRVRQLETFVYGMPLPEVAE